MHAHRTDAEYRQLLSRAKLRSTGARLEILRVLDRADAAMTAQDVVDAAKATGADRVTIYRTLAALVDAGIAHRVDPGDRVFRFSLTDHSHCHGEHHAHEHPHVVCDSCGTVQCLPGAEVVVQGGGRGAGKAKRTPFRVKTEGVTLHGTCGKCDDKPRGR